MRGFWIWWPLLVVAMAAAVCLFIATGQVVLGLCYGVFAAALGWWSYPLRGRNRIRQAQLAQRGSHGVVIYWRPGCMYCTALRRRLGALGRSATWINIWDDADAAGFVRSQNEGNETVPTVTIDGQSRTNPPAGQVRAALLSVRH